MTREIGEGAAFPHRVVDGHAVGWYATHPYSQADKALGVPYVYQTSPGLCMGSWTLERLTAERGPIRPVQPPPGADVERLVQALTGAGRKAMPTVAAALYNLSADIIARARRADPPHGYASDLLVAGRPGSWESAVVRDMAWHVGPGIKPTRVDQAALAVLAGVLQGWVLDDARFVEVAGNLSHVMGQVADATGGWGKIVDQWLARHPQAGGMKGWALICSVHHSTAT